MDTEEEKTQNQNREPSGMEINRLIDEKLKSERQKWDFEQLQKEHKALEKKLSEAEDYIGKLENMMKDETSRKSEQKSLLGGINLGELASVALEGLIRRNTDLISKIPGAEVLAGAIKEDNREKENPSEEQESEVSFKKKENPKAETISEEEKENLKVLEMINKAFGENELRQVWGILQELSKNPELIPTVLQLVQPGTKQEIKHNKNGKP